MSDQQADDDLCSGRQAFLRDERPPDGARPLDASASIRFDFRHRSDLASTLRHFLVELFGKFFVDPDDVDSMGMAAHELIENLVKYSSGSSSSVELAIRQHAADATLTIRTSNRTTPEHADELRQTVARISGAPAPALLYNEFIKESSCRPLGSGLGLARIRAEGKMALSCSVHGDEVTLTAQTTVPVRKPPCL